MSVAQDQVEAGQAVYTKGVRAAYDVFVLGFLNRLTRYKSEMYRRDVLEPIVINERRFDSLGINYLLHCIPGTIESKSVAFDYLKGLMNPDAILLDVGCGAVYLGR